MKFPSVTTLTPAIVSAALVSAETKVALKAEGRTTNSYIFAGASQDDLIKALDPEWPGPIPHTLLVGHEPTLTRGMMQLTGISGAIELKKAGCYGVRIEEGGGRLEWMLPPKLLRT